MFFLESDAIGLNKLFYEPLNYMTLQSSSKSKTSIIVSEAQKFYDQGIVTYLPKDFDGLLTSFNMPKANYSLVVS